MTDPTALVHTPSALHARILTDWAGFRAIEPDWRALHGQCNAGIFTAFDWLDAQQDALGHEGQPWIVTLWQGARLRAAAPLMLVRRKLSKLLARYEPETLTTLQCKYTGYTEFLASDMAAFDALIDAIARSAGQRVIDLELLTVDGHRDRIADRLARRGRVIRPYPQFVSTIMSARTGWDDYLATRSRSFRKTLRKMERALEERGAELSVFDSPDSTVMARLADISRRSWKELSGTGLAATPENLAFASAIWDRFARKSDAFIAILSQDGVDFAFCFTLRQGATWYGIWVEFDEAYRDLSPGRMIISRSLHEICARGPVARFDCMRKTHFTEMFGDQDYDITGLRALPRVSLARLLDTAETAARRALGHRRLRRRKALRRGDVIDPTQGGVER